MDSFAVDDPTLALIVRFVGAAEPPDAIDGEFLRHQVAAIQEYVGRFPSIERESRAYEWIETNAAQYRRKWQEQTAIDVLARRRCPDCPLAEGDDSPCDIHAKWLSLLKRYVAGELSSDKYVQWSLALLEAHKDHLKVTCARRDICPPSHDAGVQLRPAESRTRPA